MGKRRIDWTPSQRQAIDTMGRDVLVTASAGTGKTAVLTERVVQLLADRHNPTDVSQILVLTFTEAAAEEMKSRIASRLREEYHTRYDPQLYRQLLELDTAQISTIHSFCMRTIQDHFYELEMDPVFGILESDQQRLLKSQILDEVVEQAWNDPGMNTNLAHLLAGRNRQAAQSLLEQVIGISTFLDGMVSREDWLKRACLMSDLTGTAQTRITQARQKFLAEQLRRCRARCLHTCILDQRLANGHWSSQIAQEYLESIDTWMRLLQKGQWQQCIEKVASFKPPNFKNKPKDMEPLVADRIKDPVKKAKERLHSLGESALYHPDYERLVAPNVARDTRTVIELTKRFDVQYAKARQRLHCLDFADLEHYLLRLLQDRSEVAKELRSRFSHIFIDEYQDINTVQQTILDSIRRTDNLFVVGDVKQSIYAFRQSRPQILLDQLDAATASGRQRVDLQHNFRSRPEILRFVNTLFERIMTRESAATDYDESARLVSGLEYKSLHACGTGRAVEMVVMNEEPAEDRPDTDSEQDDSDFTEIINASQRQAAFIARRIREMVGAETGKAEFQILDKETCQYRDLRYGDIVILMRSLSGRVREYVEMLRLAGIPVSSQTSAGYFAATEIADMIALLKVLDNPQCDIELAAVLRSAFVGFTDNELAHIRLDSIDTHDPAIPFHRCVFQYAQKGQNPSLKEKLTDALTRLSQWRQDAQRGNLADVIWHILRSTGYLAFVGALPNGRQRRANLLMLHDRAVQFENFMDGGQGRSLRRFVEFIEQLLDQQQDWAPAQADSIEDAVRIMSVHKSKGLEFPVVFLAELNRKFNRESVTGDCIFDEDHTLGLQVITPDRHGKIRSMMHELIAEKQWSQALAEEMRILYVAMTRARERLVLCASRKRTDCQTILEHCTALGTEPLPGWLLGDVACPLDWVLYSLGNQKTLQDLFEINNQDILEKEPLFDARLIDRDQLNAMTVEILEAKRKRSNNSFEETIKPSPQVKKLAADIVHQLEWVYPHRIATEVQAKYSVSELTHRDDEFAPVDLPGAFQRIPAVCTVTTDPVSTRQQRQQIGSASHLVIELLDLTKSVTRITIEDTLVKLIDQKRVASPIAAMIDREAILEFFQAEPGRLAVGENNRVHREWPFTLGLGADQVNPEVSGDIVIVQGIVDMIVETAEGLIVIDFKTDHVRGDEVNERVKQYKAQVDYYCLAASLVLRKPISAAYLHFLFPRTTVQMQ